MSKPFSWSYSKFKNYAACPKRHYEVDIAKNFSDSGEQLIWGNEVHHALAAAALFKAGLKSAGAGRDQVLAAPLPDSMKGYQKYIDTYADPSLPGDLKVENKWAITKAFQPTSWFGNDVWMRGIGDLVRIKGAVARAVDWKTGKIVHDSRQLMLLAQTIFSFYPQVRRVLTEFVWLKDDAVTPEAFDRATIHKEWPQVLEQVKQMEHAAATLTYPPKPGHLCARYCPVVSCPFHGKYHK